MKWNSKKARTADWKTNIRNFLSSSFLRVAAISIKHSTKICQGRFDPYIFDLYHLIINLYRIKVLSGSGILLFLPEFCSILTQSLFLQQPLICSFFDLLHKHCRNNSRILGKLLLNFKILIEFFFIDLILQTFAIDQLLEFCQIFFNIKYC